MARQPSKAELNGAIALLVKCVALESGDTLALFYDETSDDISELLTLAAAKLGIVISPAEFPQKCRPTFGEETTSHSTIFPRCPMRWPSSHA